MLHQLIAIPVLRKFPRLDRRAGVEILAEWFDLRSLLSLDNVPDHSTLWKSERALLTMRAIDRPLAASLYRARGLGVIEGDADDRTAATDSTGLEVGHASMHS